VGIEFPAPVVCHSLTLGSAYAAIDC
jgi:hypothetical protein